MSGEMTNSGTLTISVIRWHGTIAETRLGFVPCDQYGQMLTGHFETLEEAQAWNEEGDDSSDPANS